MCLKFPIKPFSVKESKRKIDGLPTYTGWRFFKPVRGSQGYTSPIQHCPWLPFYEQGKTIYDTTDKIKLSDFLYYQDIDGEHQPGFFIYPTRHEALLAYRVANYIPDGLHLAKVRYAEPVAHGIDESTQRCVVARRMVIDFAYPVGDIGRVDAIFSLIIRQGILHNQYPIRYTLSPKSDVKRNEILVRKHKDGHLVFNPKILRRNS